MSQRDRVAIFRHTVAAERYGRAQSAALLLLLAAGGICYDVAARLPSLRPQGVSGAAGGAPSGPAGNEAIGGHGSPTDGGAPPATSLPRDATPTALRPESKT